jgi:hypothetical protein
MKNFLVVGDIFLKDSFAYSILRIDFLYSLTTSLTDWSEPIIGGRSKHKERLFLGGIFFVESEYFLFGDNDGKISRRGITQTKGQTHFIFT